MRTAVLALVAVVVSVAVFFSYYFVASKNKISITDQKNIILEKPLDKYTIENLSKAKFETSEIEIGAEIKGDLEFTSYVFYFYVDGKKVSGQVNIPNGRGPFPVIVMYRGYIDREGYKIGDGTRRSGEVFTKNGFVTIAPDFLGYGQSDAPSNSVLEERFGTYVVAIALLKSVDNLNNAFEKSEIGARVESEKIGIWGHSNGGQITLTVLEATGVNYPTVLWAPVSKPFPYSILYYTDDTRDHGKMLRRVVADFEKDYDSERYSLTNYLDKINASIQLHQGSGDEAVPVKWSDDLAKVLKDKGKDLDYFVYSGDDHNFSKGSWQSVVNRNMEFYKKNFK